MRMNGDSVPLLSGGYALSEPSKSLWSASDYAVWRGATLQAVAHERCRGNGPPFIKLGKRVFYDPVVVRNWFAQHQVRSTSDVRR